MSEDKYRAALDMAAKQLSYRALSAKMLRDKLLAKGHDEEAADYALAWLTERSMLNDELFAESVVRSYTRKGYGAARIRQDVAVLHGMISSAHSKPMAVRCRRKNNKHPAFLQGKRDV